MKPRKTLQLAYTVAAALLFVGILSYAAPPAKPPEKPLRIMYRSLTGKVMFDHKAHFSPERYGISCQDCHHHPGGEDTDLRACGDCHQPPTDAEPVPAACLDCHYPEDVEGMEMSKSVEAAHAQCIDCHREYDAGPVECLACHVP